MSQQNSGLTTRIGSQNELSEGRSGQMADQAADKARETAEKAKTKARGSLRDQVDQRSQQAGQQLSSTGGDLRAVGDQLRERGNEHAARLADQAAHHTERVADYLNNSSADRILADIEDYARKQPWTVALGGLALGFAASRLLRASSQQRSAGRNGTPSNDGQPTRAAALPPTYPATSLTPGDRLGPAPTTGATAEQPRLPGTGSGAGGEW